MPDFRWMPGRKDSPQYDSVKLFRQAKAGDWGEVQELVIRATAEPFGLQGP